MEFIWLPFGLIHFLLMFIFFFNLLGFFFSSSLSSSLSLFSIEKRIHWNYNYRKDHSIPIPNGKKWSWSIRNPVVRPPFRSTLSFLLFS